MGNYFKNIRKVKVHREIGGSGSICFRVCTASICRGLLGDELAPRGHI